MDREKAIQILKRCEAESYCSHYKRHYCCIGCGQREALDLAIEALSDMSEEEVDYCNNCPYISYNEDCISRQDAIYALTGWETEHLEGDIKRTLENLPPVTPRVSEDCISREDAMEALDRIGSVDTEADREYARDIFDNLPPVTPTERTGEWYGTGDGYADGELVYDTWECSECGYTIEEDDTDLLPKYCQECGAKMGGMDNEV